MHEKIGDYLVMLPPKQSTKLRVHINFWSKAIRKVLKEKVVSKIEHRMADGM